jgi:hypothetical protein
MKSPPPLAGVTPAPNVKAALRCRARAGVTPAARVSLLKFCGSIRVPAVLLSGWLLLKDDRRPADSIRLERDGHLDAIGDFDEGDAAVHPVVLTVEVQCPANLA